MEIIYLILFFLAPGLILKGINDGKKVTGNKTDKAKTIYEKLFLIVVNSTLISIICIAVIKIFHMIMKYDFPTTISHLTKSFDTMNIFLSYILLMVIVTTIYGKFISCKKIKNLWIKIHNKILEKEYGIVKSNSSNRTVWEDIFFNPEINKDNLIVAIYKDGQFITCGEIRALNTENDNRRELKICYTSEYEKILELDKNKPPDERWLHYVNYEYLDMENGYLFKFYDPRRVNKNWDSFEL